MEKNNYDNIIENMSKHIYKRLVDIKFSGSEGETDFVLGEKAGYQHCLDFIQERTFVDPQIDRNKYIIK